MRIECTIPIYFYEVFKCMYCAKISIREFNVKLELPKEKILLQRQMYSAVKSIIWLNVMKQC